MACRSMAWFLLLISLRTRELVIRSDDRHIGSISPDTSLETLLQRGLSLPLGHVTLKVIVYLESHLVIQE